jgi:transcriptional regulator with XRE-family HTH domain
MAKKQKTKRVLISEQFKRLIEEGELSRYRIAKETGISQATLSGFVNGKRSLSLANLDKIGELFDLEVAPRKATTKGER